MIDELNVKNGPNGKITHPDRNLIVSYVTGYCSADARKVIEEHCIDCLDCRTQLSILLHLITSSADREEHRKFTDLLSLGKEAAARARSIIMTQEERHRNRSGHLSVASWKRLRIPRLVLAPALITIVLIAGSLHAYFVSSRQSSEERMLARIRTVHGNTRLTQARVTGGFAYKQYVETRNPGDSTGVDERLRAALLSELDLEALAHQRAATLHNLGRLFILQGDLNPAEQQFLMALKERPRDAGLLADLGALYYERSRKEGYEQLLHKAAEHLSNAVEIDPKLAEAWFNRALCYERMNLFLQAESDWKQYLKLDSDSAWAEEAREHLNGLQERANRLGKLEQNVQNELRAAEAAGDEVKMRDLVAAH